MLAPMAVVAGLLLAVFWLLDRRRAAADPPAPAARPLRVKGLANTDLLALMVLLQGLWQPGEVALLGQPIGLERLFGMALLGMALLGMIDLVSLRLTPLSSDEANMFSWGPFEEVARLSPRSSSPWPR